MSTKIEESLKQQKEQLATLKTEKEKCDTQAKALAVAIPQLEGAIAALEYVQTLGLVEPPKESETKLKSVK